MPAKPSLPVAIYSPAPRAAEYSELAANPYRGCTHGCSYCYVPSTIHMTRANFDAHVAERPRFREAMQRDASKLAIQGRNEQIFMAFTSDVWHPRDTSLTRDCLKILREWGQSFCCLTKGAERAERDLDLFRPERDAFATTLISADDRFSRKWERNAPAPTERLRTMRRFAEKNIFCWASIEPVVDPAHALAAIEAAMPWASHFKIGKLTGLRLPEPFDEGAFVARCIELLSRAGRGAYFKESLQAHVPATWDNRLRRPQHY